MIMAFRILLDGRMNTQEMERYGSRAGRRDWFDLARVHPRHCVPTDLVLCCTSIFYDLSATMVAKPKCGR